MGDSRCSFTGSACDGGLVYGDGTVGCGYKGAPGDECAWLDELTDGTSPRDFYNQTVMEVIAS